MNYKHELMIVNGSDWIYCAVCGGLTELYSGQDLIAL